MHLTASVVLRTGRRLALIGASAVCSSCFAVHIPQLAAARPDAIGAPVSRADAIADIDTMLRVMEDVHPDLYAIRPRDSVSADRQHLVAALPEQVTRTELWTRLAPFVARFGDGHTAVFLPGEDIARLQTNTVPLFPATVAVDEERHLVTTAVFGDAGDLRRGDRLLDINGSDADSLLRAWMLDFSGESDKFRADQVAGGWRTLMLVHGYSAPFKATVLGTDGTQRAISATGITQEALRALVLRGSATTTGQRQSPQLLQSVAYRALRKSIGYVDVRNFAGEPATFAARMSDVFTQVAANADSTLLIDLRTNPGGDSRLADELLRHITTTPYRMTARKDWKMSAEYRAYLRSFAAPPLQWIHAWNLVPEGRALFRGPDGSIVSEVQEPEAHERAEPFFRGRVCILIGPGTFSTASDLADAIKTYHLARLVGEETGGRVNTFGEAYRFRLPRSQLAVQVSSAYFVRASGDTTDHRGVVPDVLVTPTAEDRMRGSDAVVESAIQKC